MCLLPGPAFGILRADRTGGVLHKLMAPTAPGSRPGRRPRPPVRPKAGADRQGGIALDDFLSQRQFEQLVVGQLREQVNNVMAALQLLTPVIRERGEEKHEQYLAIANQGLYRLLRMMGNVEFVQKARTEEPLLRTGALDMAGLCRALCRQVEPLAARAGVAFHYEESKGNVLMGGDAALLRRMLLNLISNALLAAGPGGQAGVRLGVSGERVLLTVWDAPGDRPGRPLRPLEETIEGEGLGLIIARYIAGLHQGSVVFEHQEQGGRAVASLPIGSLPRQTTLRTPRADYDPMGGFSPVLVELSDALPYQAFTADDVE